MKTKTLLEAATDMLHNLPEAVVDKDISAIIDFAVNELGADLHKGNTLDFGQGSVIKVSKKGGKILFDGGMSTGKEYFKNAKDAIASLAVGMDESVLSEESVNINQLKDLDLSTLDLIAYYSLKAIHTKHIKNDPYADESFKTYSNLLDKLVDQAELIQSKTGKTTFKPKIDLAKALDTLQKTLEAIEINCKKIQKNCEAAKADLAKLAKEI